MEEMVRMMDKELSTLKDKDSVGGLSRLLYCHFKPKCSNILSEGTNEGIRGILEESGDYFSELLFDDAVGCVVNILAVSFELYELDVQRSDEVGQKR